MQVKKHSLECYTAAQCKHCGCDIPALTFSNKSCHGNCYPPMMSKSKWNEYKKTTLIHEVPSKKSKRSKTDISSPNA